MRVGANGFGLRDSFAKGINAAIEDFKQAGLDSVEVCVEFIPQKVEMVQKNASQNESFKNVPHAIWKPQVAVENVAKLRDAGFTVISCHMMIYINEPKQVTDLIAPAFDFAEKTGIKHFVLSPMKNLTDLKPYFSVMKEASDAFAEKGLNMLLHNHEAECEVIDGATGLSELMKACPNLKLELDVGWAKFAGADAIALMEEFKDRLLLVHLKDIKADASPETRDTCFTAIGEGSIPLSDILAKAKELGICEDGIILDQDASPTSMLEDIKTGICNVKKA